MTDPRVSIAAAAAKTNRQARAQLGVAATYLRRAYELLPELSSMAGVRDAARELLDRSNLYAQAVYAKLPDDDGPIDETTRAQLREALGQADENLRLVTSVEANLRVDYLRELAGVIPAGIAAVSAAAVGTAIDHWMLTLVLLVLAAGALMVLRRRVPA